MVQAFLPEVAKGDKRIVLVDGEVAGAINRMPGEGENPLQPGGRRLGGETTLTRAKRKSAPRSAPSSRSAAWCSSAST